MRRYIHWTSQTDGTLILNLDLKFDPFRHYETVNINFTSSTFRGGEQHLKLDIDHIGESDTVVITTRLDDVARVMQVLMANDALKRLGARRIKLYAPYFPGGRQDRVCNKGEAFTLKIYADLINSCEFDEVLIITPHSDVTPALINNVTLIDDHQYILKAVNDFGGAEMNIVCPDAGAGKRVQSAIQFLNIARNNPTNRKYHLVRCEKYRNIKTGQLEAFYVGEGLKRGANTIILDDVNSMGGTFIGLGEKLREAGCGQLALFTTHTDCDAGVENVCKHFDHVYTTNSKSLTVDKPNKFTCFKLNY